MSRLNTPGMSSARPMNNVYTGLALIAALVTLGALIFVFMKFNPLN